MNAGLEPYEEFEAKLLKELRLDWIDKILVGLGVAVIGVVMP